MTLRADMGSILKMRGPEPESCPVGTVDDSVLAALFTAHIAPPPKPRERTKRHYSSYTSEGYNACS